MIFRSAICIVFAPVSWKILADPAEWADRTKLMRSSRLELLARPVRGGRAAHAHYLSQLRRAAGRSTKRFLKTFSFTVVYIRWNITEGISLPE